LTGLRVTKLYLARSSILEGTESAKKAFSEKDLRRRKIGAPSQIAAKKGGRRGERKSKRGRGLGALLDYE